MHSDLSSHLHTDKCNQLIKQLQECHQIHNFAKFWGACNDLDRLMVNCLRKERESRRQRNAEAAKIKRQQIKSTDA